MEMINIIRMTPMINRLMNLLTGTIAALLILGCPAMSAANERPYIPKHDIDFSTGNQYLYENDIRLEGPVGTFSFSRHYNSQSTEAASLGYGWSFSWNESLVFYPDFDLAVYTRSDGKVFHLYHNGTDAWVNPSRKKASITEKPDGSGYILTRSNGSVSVFNSTGRLTEKRDLNGNAVFLTYTGGNPTRISDGFGRNLKLTYTDHNRIQTLETPVGIFGYSYDDNGNLISVTRPDNTVRTYLYEDPNDVHNLTGVTDETSTRIRTVAYDSRDRVIASSLQGGGDAITIDYRPRFTRIITDSLGVASTYQLASMHGVARVKSLTGPGCPSCGSGGGSQYTYNDRQQVTSVLDERGVLTRFTYDDNGNRLSETRAAGTPEEQTVFYTYDPVLNKVTGMTQPSVVRAGQNRTITMAYNSAGNLLSRTVKGDTGSGIAGRRTTYTYDTYGRITRMDGPRSDVDDTVDFTYYPNTPEAGNNRGLLKDIVNSLGHTTTYDAYTGAGKPGRITDANGISTRIEYNARGQVVQRTTGARNQTFEYDPAGRLLSVLLPDSRTVRYRYDAQGRPDRISDTQNNSIQYAYDGRGNRVEQKINDPLGSLASVVNYVCDDTGQMTKQMNPDGSEQVFGYDGAGNLINRIDESGSATGYAYDALNRLIRISEPGEVNTRFTYDRHGNQTSVIDANGLETSFLFDDFQNRILRHSPDTGTTAYTYDTAGNLLSQTDARETTTRYAYDALNRLTEITYPDPALNITYTYDQGANGRGRLTSVTDATGTTAYSYDVHGSLVEEAVTINGQPFIIGYTYNSNQELTAVTYPGGRVVRYERDAAGRIISMDTVFQGETTRLADPITHLPFGPRQDMTLGNGLAVSRHHDLQFRLLSDTAGDLYHKTYTYLPDSQVSSITDNTDPSRSQTFAYDDMNRLVSATGNYGRIDYSYDRVGNRQSVTRDAITTQYRYSTGTNRLEQVSGTGTVDYGYDPAGNPVSKNDRRFVWNAASRLEQVEDNGQPIGRYAYNARGQRAVKVTPAGTVYYIYDLSGNLIAETNETGEPLREYAYLDNQRLTLFNYMPEPGFSVAVSTSSGETPEAVSVYAFDETGRYTGISSVTDTDGTASFERHLFGQGFYRFRIDYLGVQFWSDPVQVAQTSRTGVEISVGQTRVTVALGPEPQRDAKVYLFSEAGSYLGIFNTTGADGSATFFLPTETTYTFRTDVSGNAYWSDPAQIAGDTSVRIDTGGGRLGFTLLKGPDQPMAGVKTYLFSDTGSYLGQSSTTDALGSVHYSVPRGTYKIRADYLGYQFMSEPVFVTADIETGMTLEHQDMVVTVSARTESTETGLEQITCYLFTPDGAYLGITTATDETGVARFSLPQMPYRIRADHMNQQYWSADLTWQDGRIPIEHGTALTRVVQAGAPVPDVTVYVFDETGAYLNTSGVTDELGTAGFSLPGGTYHFRADYQTHQYWSSNAGIIPMQENRVDIFTGGGTFELTVAQGDAVPLSNIRAYVFNQAGSYLGEYADTDAGGRVGFRLGDGGYKIRLDYLGHQYWTAPFSIPGEDAVTYDISHRRVEVNAYTDFNGDRVPVAGSKVYLFSSENTYLNRSVSTDENGQAFFNLPEQAYKVRLDYLGKPYMSEPFTADATTITVETGRARVFLSSSGTALADVPVYVFSTSDAYLGITGKTDTEGTVEFQLPAGGYKFRADYQSGRFWATGEVAGHTTRDIDLQTGGGTLAVTVRSGESQVIESVKCYLFSESGSYLGQTAPTDENGMVKFDVADGSYNIRADYLGYPYWSDPVQVPGTLTTSVRIEHRNTAVTVTAQHRETETILPGVKCYLFTESGAYTGISSTTDETGQVNFSLPDRPYQVRADYLKASYWSGPVNPGETPIAIPHGTLDIAVRKNGTGIPSAKVYVFNDSGAHLGITAPTDEHGNARFDLPEATYQIRVDFDGQQYWTEPIFVLPFQDNFLEFIPDAANPAQTHMYNPHPIRFDGRPPEYRPLIAAAGNLLPGLLAQPAQFRPNDTATLFWYINDHLGTPQMLVDQSGAVAWQADAEPFGSVTLSTHTVENNLRFPGQYFDAKTGLHYNWNRYYDPDTGRYLTPDPIGLDGGINPFVYALNNPINFTDRHGLFIDGGVISGPAVYIVGTAIAGGILYYGAPIAADIGQWIGNQIWNNTIDDVDPESFINEDGTVNDAAGVNNDCDKKGKWRCEGYSQYDQIGTPKHVRRGSTLIIAYGKTEALARSAWINKAQNAAPKGFTARHIMPKCKKIR